MTKEHVIQIGVTVDDDAIQKAVLEQASKEVLAGLADGFFKKDYYSKKLELDYKIKNVIAEKTSEFLEEHKDEFMKLLVHDVSDRLIRSKKFKEEVAGECR